METQTGHLLPSYKTKWKKIYITQLQTKTITRQIRQCTFCQETVDNYNKNKTIQPDWLKTTFGMTSRSWKMTWNRSFSYSSVWVWRRRWAGWVRVNCGFKGLRLTVRQLVCFGVDQGAGPRKKSKPVFAFNMIGASCATLHSKPGDSVAF